MKPETLDTITGFMRTDPVLRAAGFANEDIEFYRTVLVKRYHECEDLIEELENKGTAKTLLPLLAARADLLYWKYMLKYYGTNPNQIPVELLREVQQLPLVASSTENKYRVRIKNRATGIRAFCVACMGGEVPAVRECSTLRCVLWPFRMGTDPLRGARIAPPVALDVRDVDIVNEFEEDGQEEDDDAD